MAEPRGAIGHGLAGRHTPLKAAGPGWILLLPLLLLVLSCFTAGKELPRQAASRGAEPALSGGEAETRAAGAGPEPGAETPSPALPRMALIPEEVRPGEPFVVAFLAAGDGSAGNYRAVLYGPQGERIAGAAFFRADRDRPELLAAALAAPSTAPPGEALARIERDGMTLEEMTLRIAGREFLAEEIALDRRNTALRTLPDPQKTLESEQLAAIIRSAGTEVYAGGPFAPPVESTRRTSLYGDRRVYRYAGGGSDTAIHAGLDYGVPRGTEVRACAAGKVALAQFRIATGNSVVLEHLPGLYSLYYHLDTLQVSQGDMVNPGDLLGRSGSTGLATGPHLHWEIRVSGESADPDAFLARAVLDKDAIFSKLGK